MTANDSLNVPVKIPKGLLDGRWFPKEKTQSHESQEFIENKNRSLCDSWQVGLKKSQEDPLVFQQGDDDIKGKVLHCKECNYQTPSLKPSKAKQKLNAHEYSRHNKEDLPKAKEVLHDILEITKDGTESYNDVLDVEQVVFAQQKDLPETICILCGHSLPTMLHSRTICCPGCHF